MKTIKKEFKIIKVSQTEFEIEDGTIYPILFELDYIPTIEEFQEMINNSHKLILNLLNSINGKITNN
jgi:hypothetical protein